MLRSALCLLALAQPALAQEQPDTRPAPVVAPQQQFAPPVPYPAGATGDEQVVLELEIDQEGKVAKVSSRTGRQPFENAARLGVLNWRFVPATRGGIPVRARILVEIHFTEPRAAIGALPSQAPQRNVEEIRVLGDRRQEIGSTYIPREDARRIPGTFGDPFRVTEVMPGVAPILSGIPYFFVRGAPPGDIGYMIDGIRVPLLFHVGPGPSVISPALVERVDFLPSAYPARLGRFAGAIVSGETTPPGTVARGEFQARIFDSNAMLEVPFADGHGTLLFGGRYSYMGPVLSLVAPEYRLEYWDYQARIAYRWDAANTLSVFAFGASDELENKDTARLLFDTQFHRIDVRWDHQSSSNRTRAGITLGLDQIANEDQDAVDEEGSLLKTRTVRAHLDTQEKISSGFTLRAGMEYELERIANESDFSLATSNVYPGRSDLSGAVFLDSVLQPMRAVELVPGIRVDTGVWRRDTYLFLEPRLASRVRLGTGMAWTSTFGRVHQLPTRTVRIPGVTASPLESSVQEAWQAAEGLEFALPSSMLGKLTLFHSWINADQTEVSGRNFGMEVFLRRDFSERLGGFLSYTLSRTELTMGRENFLSEFDRPHLISAALGYDFGAGFRLGWRAYYSSGQTFAVGCTISDDGANAPPGTPCFRGRLPDFFRIDVRFEKRWQFSSGAWLAATFEWFNAAVSREAYDIEWVPASGVLRPKYQPALTTPSLGLEGGF